MKNKLFLFLLLFYTLGTKASKNDDFSMIMEKIVQSNTIVCSDSIVDTIIPLFQSDGSYSDIDYDLRDRAVWLPSVHLDRLTAMVYSYITETSSYYGESHLYDKILSGLQFWYDKNPVSDNWWWQQISSPQKMGVILIGMEQGKLRIADDLKSKIIKRWEETGGTPEKFTGGNQVDVALHFLYRACLLRDEDLLNYSIKNIFESIKYVNEGEGIRFDNSYMAHGDQLYIGGYGETQLYGQTPIAYYLQGTKFQLDKSQIEFLGNYIRETFMPCIRGQVMAYNAHGRGITRKDYLKRTERWNKIINCWKNVETSYEQEYEAFLTRINGKSSPESNYSMNRIFYQGDFLLHVRPQYTFTVRMSSDRTIRSECVNSEGLKSYFVCDGSTCLQVDGDEYENIMPIWDWNFLPGVTAPQLEDVPFRESEWGVWGTSTFCGGVSDGVFGIATYCYYDDYGEVNTGAKKAWFCFDNVIVCLGSDIRSKYDKVYTNVEQNWGGRFGVNILTKDNQWYIDNSFNSCDIQCVHHGKTAYYFPLGGTVVGGIGKQSGNWYDINNSEENKDIEGAVFNLNLENRMPDNNTYSYYLFPNVKKDDCVEVIKNLNVKVLQNNDTIQAVFDEVNNLFGIVFYRASKFYTDGLTIKVYNPCSILLKKAGNNGKLYVSDPSHTQDKIRIDYRLSKSDNISTRYVELPCEIENRGKTVKVELERNISTDNNIVYVPNKGIRQDEYVYDISGKKVKQINDVSNTTNGVLKSGLYIKDIIEDGNRVKKKVIIR